MPFDRDSGQMFDEVVKSVPKKDEDDLVYVEEPRHVRNRPQATSSAQGTRSLYKMAMLKVLRSLDLLYVDLLKAFPTPILEKIWKAIRRNNLDGFKMWKLFAPFLVSTDSGQSLVKKLVKRPRISFGHAIDQGLSLNCSWLTELTLDSVPLTMAEYVHVSKMENLVSLAVVASLRNDVGFSDRVLRAWAADAKVGHFGRLQYICMSGHRYVTEQVLAPLSNFQMLALVCAHNCRFGMSRDDVVGTPSSQLVHEEWHDPPNGSFRTFLKTKSATFARTESDAPFPSSFHAYTAHCRRAKYSHQSVVPHLLMTLMTESKPEPRAQVGRHAVLHCFERNEGVVSDTQTDAKPVATLTNKRRKLKNGKVQCLNDMLEGFS